MHSFIRSGLLIASMSVALGAVAAVPPDQELVLFDPFSPRTNPELWSPDFLARVRERCLVEPPGALLATFCAPMAPPAPDWAFH